MEKQTNSPFTQVKFQPKTPSVAFPLTGISLMIIDESMLAAKTWCA